ncbi:MAG: hypothetical protein ABIJ97_00090 [Bacteroidota bacterium]
MNIINFLYRLLLTFNSTSLIIVIFLVKEGCVIGDVYPNLYFLPTYVSYIIYFLIPVVLTYVSLLISRWLDNDSIMKEDNKPVIIEVEQANNAFLPSYLGYFFVALSVTYSDTLIFVFGILFLFTYFSQTLYFNPLFLLFRFHFYYLTTCNKTKIFLITRKQMNDPDIVELPKLKRINSFTFIDKKK